MHTHATLLHSFYDAFARRDADTMCGCYNSRVEFSDPVFPGLRGPRAGAMWQMLCAAGKDLVVEHDRVEADDHRGTAHWVATYYFSATGRRVVNRIDASFEFAEGRVTRHTDRFDLWGWTRQALGPIGWVAGWAPPLQARIRKEAARGLDSWIEKRGLPRLGGAAPTGS